MTQSNETQPNLFLDKTWTKTFNSVKRKMKTWDISVKFVNESRDYKHHYKITLIKENDVRTLMELVLHLHYGDDKRLQIRQYGFGWEAHEEAVSFILQQITKGSQLLGFDTIILHHDYLSYKNFFEHFDVFKEAKTYLDGGFPLSLLGIQIEQDEDEDSYCHRFFIPLNEENIKRKINNYKSFNQAIERQKKKDVTFQILQFYVNSEFTQIHFYYEGFTGKLRLTYLPTTDMVLEEGASFWEKNILLEKDNLSPMQVESAFDEMIAYVVNKNALPNLLEAPRKHTYNYMDKHFHYALDKERVYDLLLQTFDPKELEIKAVTSDEQTRYYMDDDNSASLAELFGHYFISVVHSKEIFVFTKPEEAIAKFSEVLHEIENTRHQKALEVNRAKTEKAKEIFN